MNNKLIKIAIMAAIIAIVVVIALKLMGQENTTVYGGGIAGGVAGAIAASMMNKDQAS